MRVRVRVCVCVCVRVLMYCFHMCVHAYVSISLCYVHG